jgi:hypothetical protein
MENRDTYPTDSVNYVMAIYKVITIYIELKKKKGEKTYSTGMTKNNEK